MEENTCSRRWLLGRFGMVASVLTAIPVGTFAADALPHLSPSDPVASALGYTENAAQIDPSKSPSYQPGAKCANCMQNSGAPGQTWGPCKLFPGKLVNANGWCRGYIKKG